LQEELDKKDKWLHIQLIDTDKLQKALRDKEYKLSFKEKEVNDAVHKESELIIKLESERKNLDLQMKELTNLKEKEKIVEKSRQQLNNDIGEFNDTKLKFKTEKLELNEVKLELEQKGDQLNKIYNEVVETKVKLAKQIEEYTALCQEHQSKIQKVSQEEEWNRKRQTELDSLEERLLNRQKEFMYLSHKHQEMEEMNSNLKITQENIIVQMENLTQKERFISTEREKIATLSSKLSQLEQDMESEHHTLKMELNRQKKG